MGILLLFTIFLFSPPCIGLRNICLRLLFYENGMPNTLPVRDLSLVFLEAGSSTFDDGFVHRKQVPFTIIAQATRGRYEISCEGRHALCEPGGAFVTGANLPLEITHHGGAKRSMDGRWIHIHATLHGSIALTSLLELPLALTAQQTRPFGHAISELLALKEGTMRDQIAGQEIGFRVLRRLCDLAPVRAERGRALQDARLLSTLDFIRTHLQRPLSVGEMAEQAHLSVSAFHAFFQRAMGCTPMQYIKDMRLQAAQNLLLVSDTPMSQIAKACGFADGFHFSREFKRALGMPPSVYRRQHQDLLV